MLERWRNWSATTGEECLWQWGEKSKPRTPHLGDPRGAGTGEQEGRSLDEEEDRGRKNRWKDRKRKDEIESRGPWETGRTSECIKKPTVNKLGVLQKRSLFTQQSSCWRNDSSSNERQQIFTEAPLSRCRGVVRNHERSLWFVYSLGHWW